MALELATAPWHTGNPSELLKLAAAPDRLHRQRTKALSES